MPPSPTPSLRWVNEKRINGKLVTLYRNEKGELVMYENELDAKGRKIQKANEKGTKVTKYDWMNDEERASAKTALQHRKKEIADKIKYFENPPLEQLGKEIDEDFRLESIALLDKESALLDAELKKCIAKPKRVWR